MRVKNVISLIVAIVLAVVSGVDALTYTGGVEYLVGSGSNQATIAIDFDLGNSFLFTYQWEDTATGWDALTAITTDEALDIESTSYSWGELISDFDYPGGVEYVYDPADSVGWHYYLSDDNENWASSMVGVTDRALTDGAWDSWVWTNYEPDWGPAYRGPGEAPIPEPATFLLLCLGGLGLRRRTG